MRSRRTKQGRRSSEALPMSFIDRLFRRSDGRETLVPLYNAVIERARQPHWYVEGGVTDSVDGRFDMIAAILAIVLIRLERNDRGKLAAARLTELFVSDMDGQLREIGVGDVVVGKHIGKMMSALGGRLTAYRDGLASGSLDDALVRNLYRGERPADTAVAHVGDRLTRLADALSLTTDDVLLAGTLPPE
jgi:cytochrome b pre-mRNA-processing protein 3